MQLDGKVVLITGASQGIGAACAEAFRRRGARLALTARNEARLKQVAGPDGLVIAGDITRSETRQTIVERTLAHYGTIDVLVNNAGVGLYAPAYEAPMAQVRELFELNFFVPLQMIQLTVPVMKKNQRGTLVNISSIAGKLTLPWLTLYSASKHAVCALTDGLRMELKRDKIHALAVCPGYVDTGFQRHAIAGRPPVALQRGRPLAIPVAACAEAIARGVEHDTRTLIAPARGQFAIAAARLFPGIAERRLERMYPRTR